MRGRMAKRRKDELGDRVVQRLIDLHGPEERPDRLTQQRIADLGGITQQQVSQVLNRKRPCVPLDLLDAVARAFGATLASLLEAMEPLPYRDRSAAVRKALAQWIATASDEEIARLLKAAAVERKLRQHGTTAPSAEPKHGSLPRRNVGERDRR